MASPPIDDPPALFDELCRRSFPAFARKAWPLINGGTELRWNWHLDALCWQLHLVAIGECLRLMVNIPPRNGKSMVVSVLWVAWRLGLDPSLNFVCVSYSNELSTKLARDCRAIMQSDWYRNLFARTRISTKRTASHDFDTTRGGGRLATSVTGTLTGRGGDIVILDDVIKPDEALSQVSRERVNNWFSSTLASRHDDKRTGPIILVMQRLHEDDLCGRLLEAGGWDRLSLPAIARHDEVHEIGRERSCFRKKGEALHPEREPLEVLDAVKAMMGSTAFEAQYQQEPVPAHGNLIKSEWLRNYDRTSLDLNKGKIVQSWDTATKDNPYNDYSACVTAFIRGRDVYVLDVFRARLQFPELKARVIAMAREYEASTLLIEDHSSGSQLLQTLRAEEPRGVPDPSRCQPEGDKAARVMSISAMIEAGHLLLPKDAPWLAEFTSELLGFPNAKSDDQVDALSQLMIWRQKMERLGSEPDGYRLPVFFRNGEPINLAMSGAADDDAAAQVDQGMERAQRLMKRGAI